MSGLLTAAASLGDALIFRGPSRRCVPMMWRVAALLALALAIAAPGPASAETQSGPKATYFVLDNGMEVVVVPNDRVPVVTGQVWYKSGGAEDPDDQPGIAHFLEHLMFKGTERYPGNSFEKFIVANGGAGINAFTYQDVTLYPNTLPKTHLAALMEREADRMVNLLLNEDVVRTEIGVVQNERRGNENSPSYLLGEKIRAALFPGHPYGRSIIGTESEIATLTRAKALAYYKRFYAPNNAILVVAGDVTPDEVRKLADSTFGRIPPNKDLPKRVIQPLPKAPTTLRIDMEHERVATPSVGFYYVTPGVHDLANADAIALNLMSRAIGADIIGRFYRKLVIEQRIATGVSASHWYDLRGGILSFTADAAPGVAIADLEAALGREIAALAKDGVTDSELDDARKGYLALKAYEDDSHRTVAGLYGQYLSRGRPLSDVEQEFELAGRTSTADVNRVIARFLAKTDPLVAILRPKAPELSQVATPAPK